MLIIAIFLIWIGFLKNGEKYDYGIEVLPKIDFWKHWKFQYIILCHYKKTINVPILNMSQKSFQYDSLEKLLEFDLL